MASAAASAFVTGAASGIGTELIRELKEQGCQVLGLAETPDEAHRVRRAGAIAVLGRLLEPGPWLDEAAADWVFHLPPVPLGEARLTRRRAASMARARLSMDAQLLDALAGSAARRIVYMADTSGYGAVGTRPVTEDELPRPSIAGRCLRPVFDRLDCYVAAGLPIVTALPGWVFGEAAWFRARVIEPVVSGRRVLQFGARGAWVSPVHVQDCARALVHLAGHAKTGGRYFLVNDEPVSTHDVARLVARLANRPLRSLRAPVWTASLVAGAALGEALTADAVFSNIRLRGLGFRFRYPTLELGMQQVLGARHD
jgi:hypothetical protein